MAGEETIHMIMNILYHLYIKFIIQYIYEQLHLFAMMRTRCGVKQGLWNCWFRLQNEIKTRWGDSKNEVGLERD